MTGKESLEQLKQKYSKYIIEWYYMSNMSKEERDRLYKMYDEEFESIDKELTKYKKAFEIFKGREVQVYPKFDGNTQYVITLNKEEYELLEELMESESR